MFIKETIQAFYFNIAFYLLSFIFIFINPALAFVGISISLMISLIWLLLVLREILLSAHIDGKQKAMYALLVIVLNVLGGAVYFYKFRDRVVGSQTTKK